MFAHTPTHTHTCTRVYNVILFYAVCDRVVLGTACTQDASMVFLPNTVYASGDLGRCKGSRIHVVLDRTWVIMTLCRYLDCITN
jgi:hypothetical protein